MKRAISILFLLLLILSAQPYSNAADNLAIKCEGGAILVDFQTSKILFEQDADKRWCPASITKMMTAIVALENGKLSDDIRFTKKATAQGGTKVGINEGVRIPLYPLIEAMLVKSGNDAAMAIAEHVGGSEDGFVKMMNKKAKDIGMMNTNFANPTGMPNDNNYSTARDIAKLAVYAMGREEFRTIVSKSKLEFVTPDGSEETTLFSTNKLLGRHPLVDGIKTGFTNKSKYCLAASAAFRDYRLISVVLGAERDGVWLETARLLDYGFRKHDPLYPLYREFDSLIIEDTDNSQPED
jgi:serine-type D-Ala-D-Ala carboxypeptidase (penicillin-binding protein 5/6)